MDLGELTLKLGADWGDALSQLGTLKDALSGAFAPPDVSAVLGAFDQVSQAAQSLQGSVAAIDLKLPELDTSSVTDSLSALRGEVQAVVDQFGSIQISMPSGSISAGSAAADMAAEVAQAFGSQPIPISISTETASSAAADVATEIAQSLGSIPLNIDTTAAQGELQWIQEQAQQMADAIGSGATVTTGGETIAPAIDTSAAEASLQALDDAAASSADQIASDFAGAQLAAPDDSAVTAALSSLPDDAVTAAQGMSSDLAGVTLAAPDVSGITDALGGLPADAQAAGDAISADLAASVPSLDVSPIVDALDTIDPAAQAVGSQIGTDLAASVQPLDVTPITDSLAGLDAAATAAGDQLGADLAASVQPLDVSPITDSLDGLETTAQGVGAAIGTDLSASVQPLDLTPIEDSLATLDTDAQQSLQQMEGYFSDAPPPTFDLSGIEDGFTALAHDAAMVSSPLDDVATAIGDDTTAADGAADPLQVLIDKFKEGEISVKEYIDGANALAEALKAAGEAAPEMGKGFDDAAASEKAYSDGAQAIIDKQTEADSALGNAKDVLAELQAAYDQGQISEETLARSANDVASAMNAATPAIHDAGAEAETSGAEFGDLATEILKLGGITLTAQAFIGLGESMVTAADDITKATIALTALTGDADTAKGMLEQLEQVAVSDGLQMPGLIQAAQNMEALLPAGTNVVGIINQLADASVVSGKSIDALSSSFDRIVNSTTVSAKQLAGLGTNLDQLKQSMIDTGAATEDFANGVAKAFGALSENDKMVVLSDDLSKFKGLAEDVANNTLTGQWHQAAALWESDLAKMGSSFEPVLKNVVDFKSVVTDVATFMAYVGGAFLIVGDEVAGAAAQIVAAATAVAAQVKALATLDFAGVKQAADDYKNAADAISQSTQNNINTDKAAAQAAISTIGSAAAFMGPTLSMVAGQIDGLGNNLAKVKTTAAESMAAAVTAVQSFDTAATSSVGDVAGLQAAFENVSKSINLVATQNLPLAKQAVTDYMSALLQAGASTPALTGAFTELSKVLGTQLKTDAAGAEQAFSDLTAQLLAGGQNALPLVTAAFNDTEKAIVAMEKDGLGPASDAQVAFNKVLVDGNAAAGLITAGFTAEAGILNKMAGAGYLQDAIAGFKDLVTAQEAAGQALPEITKTFQDESAAIAKFGTTDGPDAVAAFINLAGAEKTAGESVQQWTDPLTKAQATLETFSKTDLPDAATGMGILAQAAITLQAPAQKVNDIFTAQMGLFDQMAKGGDYTNAIAGLNGLADAQKAFQPTGTAFVTTLGNEKTVIDQFAASGGSLTTTISMLGQLAQKEVDLNAPASTVTATLDDERSKIDALAGQGGAGLTQAISLLGQLADSQVKLNQPTADVTATLDDERSKIVQLGGSNVPAAIDAIGKLIAQQKALKQPTDDINASLKVQSDLLQKEVNTDLPAAEKAYGDYLDQLNKTGDIYKAINAAGAQTIQQQSFQISSEQQLLAAANDTNLAYGDRLKIEATLAQNQINLATAEGQYAGDYILALEKIKLEEQALVDSTHGMADGIVASINDAIKGFDQLGQTMATAIVNGQNLGSALVGEFKKIAASILGDLINAALKPLEGELIQLITGMMPQFADQAVVVTAGIGNMSEAGTLASSAMAGLAASSAAATGALASMVAVIGVVAAVVGAIAGIVGDVYLAAIDTKLFTVETDLNGILNEALNLRKEQEDWFGQSFTRLGEIKNDCDTMLTTLQAMYAAGQTGAGGGIGDHNTSSLDRIAQDSDYLVTGLQNINDSIQGLIQIAQGIQTATADTDQTTAAMSSFLYVIDKDIQAIASAILYGGHTQADAISSLADAVSLGAQDMVTATTQAASAITSSQAQTSGMIANAVLSPLPNPRQPPVSTAGGGVDAGGGRSVPGSDAAAQQQLALAQSALAAAMTLNDEITALQNEISADDQLMQNAIQSGDLTLAAQYQQAAQTATNQLVPLLSSTENAATHIATSADNAVTAIGTLTTDSALYSQTASQLVSDHVDANATTISSAVYTSANNTASAFSAAITAMEGTLTSFGGGLSSLSNPYNGGGSFGTGGSTGSNLPNPVGTPTAPGGAGGIGGGYLPIASPTGPTFTPPTGTPTQTAVPYTGSQTVLTGHGGIPSYQTGGAVPDDTLANLDAGEQVLSPGLNTALQAFLDQQSASQTSTAGGSGNGPVDVTLTTDQYGTLINIQQHQADLLSQQVDGADLQLQLAQQNNAPPAMIDLLTQQLDLYQAQLDAYNEGLPYQQITAANLSTWLPQIQAAATGPKPLGVPDYTPPPSSDAGTPAASAQAQLALEKLSNDQQNLLQAIQSGNADQIAAAQAVLQVDQDNLAIAQDAAAKSGTSNDAILQAQLALQNDQQQLLLATQSGNADQIAMAQAQLQADQTNLAVAQDAAAKAADTSQDPAVAQAQLALSNDQKQLLLAIQSGVADQIAMAQAQLQADQTNLAIAQDAAASAAKIADTPPPTLDMPTILAAISADNFNLLNAIASGNTANIATANQQLAVDQAQLDSLNAATALAKAQASGGTPAAQLASLQESVRIAADNLLIAQQTQSVTSAMAANAPPDQIAALQQQLGVTNASLKVDTDQKALLDAIANGQLPSQLSVLEQTLATDKQTLAKISTGPGPTSTTPTGAAVTAAQGVVSTDQANLLAAAIAGASASTIVQLQAQYTLDQQLLVVAQDQDALAQAKTGTDQTAIALAQQQLSIGQDGLSILKDTQAISQAQENHSPPDIITALQAQLKLANDQLAVDTATHDLTVAIANGNTSQLSVLEQTLSTAQGNLKALQTLTSAPPPPPPPSNQYNQQPGFSGYNPYTTPIESGAQIPSFDLGGYVGGDMVAQLHAGEYVLSPDVVRASMSFGSGGGSSVSPAAVSAISGAGASDSHDTYNFVLPPGTTDQIMREIAARVKQRSPKTRPYAS